MMNAITSATTVQVIATKCYNIESVATSTSTIQSLLLSLPNEDHEIGNTATATATKRRNSSFSVEGNTNNELNDSFRANRRNSNSWCGTTLAQELLLERIDSPSLLHTPTTQTKKNKQSSSLRVRYLNCHNNTDYISSALSLTSLNEETETTATSPTTTTCSTTTCSRHNKKSVVNRSCNDISSSIHNVTSLFLDADPHNDDSPDDDHCGVGKQQQQQGGNKLFTTTSTSRTQQNTTSTCTVVPSPSPPPFTRKVRFSRKVKVRNTRSYVDYTSRQIKNCWYQQSEIDQIKVNCLYEIKQFQQHKKKQQKRQQQKQQQKLQQQQQNERNGRHSSEEKKSIVLSTCNEDDKDEAGKNQDQDREVSIVDEDQENKDKVNEETTTRTRAASRCVSHTRTTNDIIDANYCMRGLESYEPVAYERKQQVRTKASHLVFDLEEEGGDESTIADYYAAMTHKYAWVAHLVALQDARDVYNNA